MAKPSARMLVRARNLTALSYEDRDYITRLAKLYMDAPAETFEERALERVMRSAFKRLRLAETDQEAAEVIEALGVGNGGPYVKRQEVARG